MINLALIFTKCKVAGFWLTVDEFFSKVVGGFMIKRVVIK